MNIFQPDSRTTGAYFSQPGDYETLTQLSNGTYTLTETDGTLYAFRSNGMLNYVRDTDGNRITAGLHGQPPYEPYPLLRSEPDNSLQRLRSHPDNHRPGRRPDHLIYDANADLTSVTDYNGQVTSYSYNTAHALTSITNPDGTRQYFSYDSEGRLASTSLGGNADLMTYTYNMGEVTAKDALGDATSSYFDYRDLLMKTAMPSATRPISPMTARITSRP